MSQLNDQLTLIQNARDNMKTALEEKGQTVSKDIRTYADIINNISSGVKLFNTIKDMRSDDNIKKDDKAVIYGYDAVQSTSLWNTPSNNTYLIPKIMTQYASKPSSGGTYYFNKNFSSTGEYLKTTKINNNNILSVKVEIRSIVSELDIIMYYNYVDDTTYQFSNATKTDGTAITLPWNKNDFLEITFSTSSASSSSSGSIYPYWSELKPQFNGFYMAQENQPDPYQPYTYNDPVYENNEFTLTKYNSISKLDESKEIYATFPSLQEYNSWSDSYYDRNRGISSVILNQDDTLKTCTLYNSFDGIFSENDKIYPCMTSSDIDSQWGGSELQPKTYTIRTIDFQNKTYSDSTITSTIIQREMEVTESSVTSTHRVQFEIINQDISDHNFVYLNFDTDDTRYSIYGYFPTYRYSYSYSQEYVIRTLYVHAPNQLNTYESDVRNGSKVYTTNGVIEGTVDIVQPNGLNCKQLHDYYLPLTPESYSASDYYSNVVTNNLGSRQIGTLLTREQVPANYEALSDECTVLKTDTNETSITTTQISQMSSMTYYLTNSYVYNDHRYRFGIGVSNTTTKQTGMRFTLIDVTAGEVIYDYYDSKSYTLNSTFSGADLAYGMMYDVIRDKLYIPYRFSHRKNGAGFVLVVYDMPTKQATIKQYTINLPEMNSSKSYSTGTFMFDNETNIAYVPVGDSDGYYMNGDLIAAIDLSTDTISTAFNLGRWFGCGSGHTDTGRMHPIRFDPASGNDHGNMALNLRTRQFVIDKKIYNNDETEYNGKIYYNYHFANTKASYSIDIATLEITEYYHGRSSYYSPALLNNTLYWYYSGNLYDIDDITKQVKSVPWMSSFDYIGGIIQDNDSIRNVYPDISSTGYTSDTTVIKNPVAYCYKYKLITELPTGNKDVFMVWPTSNIQNYNGTSYLSPYQSFKFMSHTSS